MSVCFPPPDRGAAARQRGVSLIEVMVTVVILSLGLLGLAGLQANGLRASQSAFYRAQAAQYALDMTDRIRANALPATASSYARTFGAALPTGSALPDLDSREWLTRVRTLPQGDAQVTVNGNVVEVVVRWNDSRGTQEAVNLPSFTLRTQLWNS
jgi:type IV pilus assembly protein PilV